MLGAGYYTAAHTGPMQTKLKKLLARIEVEYDDCYAEHMRVLDRYRRAAPGVAEISDFLGGADLPSIGIWDRPHKMILKALNVNLGGDVITAQVYFVVAAMIVTHNAQLLADHAERSSAGAAAAVTILEAVKTAAQVVETGLTIFGVGAGIRALRVGGEAATGLARHRALEEATEKLMVDYAKKNGISAAELSVRKYVPQPPGTKLARGSSPARAPATAPAFTSGEQDPAPCFKY
jgi:hypothetical protein